MKDYLHNKQSKDSRFLAIFKKAFNKDRLRNGFTVDEAAHEMGISHGTLEQKLKPSAENDITVTEWNHHLELTADFSTLEYFAQKHGFELKKLDIYHTSKDDTQINLQADKAMIEFNEAWAKVKTSLLDHKLDRKEKNETLTEISEAIKELQQLQHDVEYIPVKE
ncbi:phage regulatory CII family protein [Aliarcobacter cryaerophilus]|uniref:phage regulatory CII family protein n=1 Tax=Aliarcobacter cryaerophilus TaxID=28198 RepID=UPI003177F12A